jgi:hypothetical protein
VTASGQGAPRETPSGTDVVVVVRAFGPAARAAPRRGGPCYAAPRATSTAEAKDRAASASSSTV